MNIIVTGNPLDGFRFIGPFATPNEAVEWATDHCTQEWWVTNVESSKGFVG